MNLTKAEYRDGVLMLHTDSRQEATAFVYKFKHGDYDIKRTAKKRSLNANSYCWELITQIAGAMAIDKDTVYRDAICAVGASEAVYIKSEAFPELSRIWSRLGLGWVAENVDDNGDMCYALLHYGSSVYNTKQMSQLIDYIVQEANDMGIETLSERERSLLLEEWGE